MVASLIRNVADKINERTSHSDVDALDVLLRPYSAADIKAGASQAGMTLSGNGKGDLIRQILSRLHNRLGTFERVQFRGK